jgi:hypothetical protein
MGSSTRGNAAGGISGLALSRAFYERAVKPVLQRHFPATSYAAALIGWGSEVLGFDTVRSRDHHWGPRALLFLRDDDLLARAAEISQCLADHLPYEFEGFTTNFSDPEPNGVRHPVPTSSGPIRHMVEIFSVRSFWQMRLGIDLNKPVSSLRWLTLPQQRLLELASGWLRISQEEAFVGRTNEANDELGARLIAARLVREILCLCFLMERHYWPYSKWFGTAFNRLPIAAILSPIVQNILTASSANDRENFLSRAYTVVAERHNQLEITGPLEPSVRRYFTRPYLVIDGSRFASAIQSTIQDPKLRQLKLLGSIDQFTDSPEIVGNVVAAKVLSDVYSY